MAGDFRFSYLLIKYRKVSGSDDTRNQFARKRTRVRIPSSPPKKVGNFDRNCLPFHFAQKPLISGLFRCPAIKKQPLRSYFRSGVFAFSGVPGTLSRTNRSHRGVLFNLRPPALFPRTASHIRRLFFDIHILWYKVFSGRPH